VLIADDAAARPIIDFRSAEKRTRVTIGQEADPVVGGRRYPRIFPAWGMLIFAPDGDERGGFTYLDQGRSVLALDRRHGEGVYLTVNERSGFAGLVANYEGRGVSDHVEAFRLGTSGRDGFAQARNHDGSFAGALAAGGGGRVRSTDAPIQ